VNDMAFIFDEKTIAPNYTVIFDGTSLKKIVCDGKIVWEPYSYLYDKGNECTNVHGGFIPYAYCGFDRGSGTTHWVSEPSITREAKTIKFTGHTSSYGSVFTKNKINLSDYSKMKVIVAATNNGGSCRIGFTQECKNDYQGTWQAMESTGTLSLDISALKGDYYLAIEIDGGMYVTVSQIYLY